MIVLSLAPRCSCRQGDHRSLKNTKTLNTLAHTMGKFWELSAFDKKILIAESGKRLILIKMERATGIEPATSSLGIFFALGTIWEHGSLRPWLHSVKKRMPRSLGPSWVLVFLRRRRRTGLPTMRTMAAYTLCQISLEVFFVIRNVGMAA